MAHDDDDWMRPGEAARILGISTRSVARAGLRFKRTPGGHRRYLRSAVMRLYRKLNP